MKTSEYHYGNKFGVVDNFRRMQGKSRYDILKQIKFIRNVKKHYVKQLKSLRNIVKNRAKQSYILSRCV